MSSKSTLPTHLRLQARIAGIASRSRHLAEQLAEIRTDILAMEDQHTMDELLAAGHADLIDGLPQFVVNALN